VPLRTPNRFAPLAGGTTPTALWLILLRVGTGMLLASPMIPWICVIASTALSLRWMRQILALEQNEPQEVVTMARAVAAGA
jgi:hypothetical protein